MDWPDAAIYVPEIRGFDPPSLFAKALCETIPVEPDDAGLIDLGCGVGIVGIFCLVRRKAKAVTFVDVLPEAIAATQANVSYHIARQTIHASQVSYVTEGFSHLPPSVLASGNLIAFNPPQLPAALTDTKYLKAVQGSTIQRTFRLGGPYGLSVIGEFLKWYASLRSPKPRAVMLVSSFLGRRQIQSAFDQYGLQASVIKETIVPLRACLTRAADSFSTLGDEMHNRSLTRSGGTWSKKLLTMQVA